MKSQGQTVYYHYNPRGDVIAMTDENGQVVVNYEYDTWRNVLKSDAKGIAAENPFGYAGYMYDKEIGMYYLIARYYNPTHGVFLSVDPDPGDEDDPITQNGYTYGNNNPVMMVDPDGHKSWEKKVHRVWYATKAGFKAGGRAVYESYRSIGKALSLATGFSIGYYKGNIQYKRNNTPAYNKKYIKKAARKAGVKLGARVF